MPKPRETQALLATLTFTFRSPTLVALEVLWRWAYGIPVLWWAWRALQPIWNAVPLALIAQLRIDWNNPFLAADAAAPILVIVWPPLLALLRGSVPWILLGWVAASTLGRVLVALRLRRLRPELPVSLDARSVARLFGLYLLRVVLLTCACLLFVRIAIWAAFDAFPVGGQPNPELYLAEVVFAGLLIFATWGAASYVVSVAPGVALAHPQAGLREIFRRAANIRGAMEVNLVLGIVKLALIVLAMVFSAVPIPFEAEVPVEQLHAWWALVTVWYLLASDFFHAARFVEMLRLSANADIASQAGIE